MLGRIPRSFIDDLLARTDIIDVIDPRVKLKKQGKSYTACCPFHNEKSPSFNVSQEKQFFHCFGCGVSGNAISFLMEYERLEFVEAIEELANKLSLEVPRETYQGQAISSEQPKVNYAAKKNIYELLSSIQTYYQQQLKSSQHRHAVDYLFNRGLTSDVIERFSIGYIPDEWNLIGQNFGKNPQAQKMLLDAGMLVENDKGNRYDRFRSRIMFPIRDRRGRVIGFGGRVLDDSKPKYLNSPETPVFSKGRELYGLYEVMQAYKDIPQILIAEGYMDVVALAQYGIDYAVASLGTSTTNEHIHLLFRQTSLVICCYDGDRAGRDAAWRTLENALPHLNDGRQLKFMFLPDGDDPDSYVRKNGKTQFEAHIDSSMTLSDFMFKTLIEQVDMTNQEGRAKLANLAIPLIEKIPGPTLRLYLRENLGKKLGLFDEQQLDQLIQKKPTQTRFSPPQTIKRTPMRVLIALLLQNPDYAKLTPDTSEIKETKLPGLQIFLALLDTCQNHPHINSGQLMEHWRGHENEKMLTRLLNWEIPLGDEDETDVYIDTVVSVFNQCYEKQVMILQAKERATGLSKLEKTQLQQLILKML